MPVVILYHSSFGGTEACARRLATLIGEEASLLRLSDAKAAPLTAADALILGASVDKGRLVRPMAAFLKSHPDLGKDRPFGVFLCHGEPDGAALLGRCYPSWLLQRARTAEAVGGSLDLRKVPRLLRFILAGIGVRESYDRIDDAALVRLAEAFR